MIQLTKNGAVVNDDLQELAAEFANRHAFRIPGLIQDDLMQSILTRMNRSEWNLMEHVDVGVEAKPADPLPAAALGFVVNSQVFLNAIQRITGFSSIKGFSGRIYRLASSEHYDSWHDDLSADERLLGMSINLSENLYSGGLFLMRQRGKGEILLEMPNTGLGDAIFFRLSNELQHMVTAIEGTVPKTAFAGWFQGTWSDFQKITRTTSPRAM